MSHPVTAPKLAVEHGPCARPCAKQAVPDAAERTEGQAFVAMVMKVMVAPALTQPSFAAVFGPMQLVMNEFLRQMAAAAYASAPPGASDVPDASA